MKKNVAMEVFRLQRIGDEISGWARVAIMQPKKREQALEELKKLLKEAEESAKKI